MSQYTLKQLRTEARNLLLAARTGDPAAVRRLRILPHLSAVEVVNPGWIRLKHALRAIALERGYSSWENLCDAMGFFSRRTDGLFAAAPEVHYQLVQEWGYRFDHAESDEDSAGYSLFFKLRENDEGEAYSFVVVDARGVSAYVSHPVFGQLTAGNFGGVEADGAQHLSFFLPYPPGFHPGRPELRDEFESQVWERMMSLIQASGDAYGTVSK